MPDSKHDVISPQQAGTLYGLFLERVKRSASQLAYRHYEQQRWVDLSWQQMAVQVARWQAALAGLQLKPGDRVGIMLRNSPYWVMFDQAAMSLGLVTVPLYTMDRAENIAYIANNAQLQVLLFESEEQWLSLQSVLSELQSIQRFISLDAFEHSCERLCSQQQFLPEYAELRDPEPCDPKGLVSLIYTSGTTGKPKGVMLSHWNMLTNAYACLDVFTIGNQDTLLSFLPLSHTFERTVGYYLSVMAGASVAFARSIPQLSEDLLQIRPTLLVSVPRIYERIYATVQSKLTQASPFKQWLFKFTVTTGWQRFEYQQGRAGWRPAFLCWPLLNTLVAEKVMAKLGGQLRTALSGGAALSPDIARVFIGLGLRIIQGYGMTETSPVVCANRTTNNIPASVGQPIDGVEVAQSEQGELLVRGPNVMLGYWNNPEATAKMINPQGWLNTGDVVRIEASGHVIITGRTKEIIVLSNGEKVPPGDMELAIAQDPLFDQVMIYGEARPYLVALVVLNPDSWEQLAHNLQLNPAMDETLHEAPVVAEILQRVKQQLSGFPGYAKVHKVHMLIEPWTIEEGLLTPTLKLKRNKVLSRFSVQINAMYEGH